MNFLPHPCAVFHVVERGSAQLTINGAPDAQIVTAGDLILLPQGDGHVLGSLDGPGSSSITHVRMDAVHACEIKRWTTTPSDVLMCGTFRSARVTGEPLHPLLAQLPRLMIIKGCAGRPASGIATTLHAIEQEVADIRAGTQTILERLTDMLFVQIIRCWLESIAEADGQLLRPGLLCALRDRPVAAALVEMLADPARAWTVGALAQTAALSRSSFAQRFSLLMGEPPLAFLASCRMRLAMQLLTRAGHRHTLTEIAAQTGYESEAAFSHAFKRHSGQAPGAYRLQADKALL